MGVKERSEVAQALVQGGFNDVLILDRGTAREVLTESRITLMEAIRDSRPESMAELSESLDRSVSNVSRDVNILIHHDIVEYERDGHRKAPVLKHETVVVEPIL